MTDAATAALRKEIGHLLAECQLYCLRLLRIDEKLVFDTDLPFEIHRKRKYTLDELYERFVTISGNPRRNPPGFTPGILIGMTLFGFPVWFRVNITMMVSKRRMAKHDTMAV